MDSHQSASMTFRLNDRLQLSFHSMCHKISEHATAEDLAWFNLINYAALKDANFGLWASVIRDRVQLEKHFKETDRTGFTVFYEMLKHSPLAPLSLGKGSLIPAHPSDTVAVKPIKTHRFISMSRYLKTAEKYSIADEVLASKGAESFKDYAHVMINMRATDDQIIANFEIWLENWRKHTSDVTAGNYRKKLDRWAHALVVPFMDLELFSMFTGKRIANVKKFEMLLPTRTISEREAQRRRLLDMKKLVFTDEMATTIELIADNAGQRIPNAFEEIIRKAEKEAIYLRHNQGQE